jgi:hypothetical protein
MKSSLKIGFMHICLQGDGEPAFSSGRTPGLWCFGFHNVTSRSTWSIKSRYQFSASQLKHLWIHHLAHSSFLLSWAEHDVCECLWNWNPRQLVCPGSFEISLCTTIFHIDFSEVFVLNVIGTTGASLPCNLAGRTGGTFWNVVKFYV